MSVRTVENEARRKRLGQYFTGLPLARLLASLASGEAATSVLDPMGGSGDMLAAVRSLSPIESRCAMIELDPIAAGQASERLSRAAQVVCGDAFDAASWRGLGSSWDLVITNPPYVRYQLGSESQTHELAPTAAEVRLGLVDCLRQSGLPASDREIFLRCASQISGLADLAVAAWILAASQVGAGGRLAVVVPSTWLSRDYAAPVLYLLRRFFELEFVVHDADMAWFEDALVRTTLVVARRVDDKGTGFGPGHHLSIELPAALSTDASVVGALGGEIPEAEFSRRAREALMSAGRVDVPGVRSFVTNEGDLVGALRRASTKIRWPEAELPASTGVSIPEALTGLVSDPSHLCTLDELGWSAGQGLRTGANSFFYVDRTERGLFKSELLPDRELDLPQGAVRASLRRQADLRSLGGRGISSEQLRSGVLALGNWALSEDIESGMAGELWRPANQDLADLIRAGADACVLRNGRPVSIPELSAVATNERRAPDGRRTRLWYQLPEFQPRHAPKLAIPRVNGQLPKPFVITDGQTLVDANFSTLWPTRPDALDPLVMLALLSSSWAAGFFESVGTVMGGGALKLEATHLRQLVLPRPPKSDDLALHQLGLLLVSGGESEASTVRAIDEVLEGFAAIDSDATQALSLRRLAARSS